MGAASWLSRFLYLFYEQRLLHQVRACQMPKHVGIILDGNRRFGRQRHLTEQREIYGIGARKLDDVLDWCAQLRIGAVTLWVLSTDNLSRPPAEVLGILAAIEAKLLALVDDPQIHHRRVHVRAVGKLDLLPGSVVAAIRAAEAATAMYNSMMLTIAVAYSGRDEIIDAFRALLREKMKERGCRKSSIRSRPRRSAAISTPWTCQILT